MSSWIDRLMKKDGDPEYGSDNQCVEWARILNKYKAGKANLEKRIKENQQFWRLAYNRGAEDHVPSPTSAWLTNVILAKHAARMDAFPEAIVLPREQSDEAEATMLTSILPSILDRCKFKDTYSQVGWDKQISCAGCYYVGWNANKYNGLGDLEISPVDLYNIFWEPGINDIQDSKYVFVVKLEDVETIAAKFPEKYSSAKGAMSKVIMPSEYVYEDSIDTSNKDAVVDVYYKKLVNGKTVVHFAKFVQDILLYSTELQTEPVLDAMGAPTGEPMAVTGLFDHGKYPFVIENLYPIKGSMAGFGYVDICKDPQRYIDIMGKAIIKNVQDNATPRYFFRIDAGVNEEDFNNLNKRLVKCNGNVGTDTVRLIESKGLDSNVLNYYTYKIDEMKQTAGNRDVNSGGVDGGVTAASAIAIMQESGNSLSRDENDTAYRAYREVILLCIELIRQFYNLPRFFRIAGERGAVSYQVYTNAKLQAQQIGGINSEYWRIPEFDLEVRAAQEANYTKSAQNNLALQFYQSGFFNPENSIATLQCLDMMDFRGKEKMQQNIMNAMGIMMSAKQNINQQAAQQPTTGQPDGGDKKKLQEDASRGETAKSAADKKMSQAEEKSKASVQPS